jgi:hypothetical protein
LVLINGEPKSVSLVKDPALEPSKYWYFFLVHLFQDLTPESPVPAIKKKRFSSASSVVNDKKHFGTNCGKML